MRYERETSGREDAQEGSEVLVGIQWVSRAGREELGMGEDMESGGSDEGGLRTNENERVMFRGGGGWGDSRVDSASLRGHSVTVCYVSGELN